MNSSLKRFLLLLVGSALSAIVIAILLAGDLQILVDWALPRPEVVEAGLDRPSLTLSPAALPSPTLTASPTNPPPIPLDGTPSGPPIPFYFDSDLAGESFGGSEMLAFVSDRDGNPEIYSLEFLTGRITRLTYSDMADFHPRWSPNGNRIAFTSYRDGGPDIHTITSTGALRQSLTAPAWFDEFPSWSVNGDWILFDSNRPDGETQNDVGAFRLFLMRTNGSDIQHVLPDAMDGAVGSFSPDGERIVFQSRAGEGEYQIYTLELETQQVVRLTHTLARNFRPSWSPDGRQIVFVSERDGQSELYIMDADGTDQRRLTVGTLEHVRGPVWSPDGEWILFNAELGGNTDLYVINLNGTHLFRLTNHPSDDYHPDWQPQIQ